MMNKLFLLPFLAVLSAATATNEIPVIHDGNLRYSRRRLGSPAQQQQQRQHAEMMAMEEERTRMMQEDRLHQEMMNESEMRSKRRSERRKRQERHQEGEPSSLSRGSGSRPHRSRHSSSSKDEPRAPRLDRHNSFENYQDVPDLLIAPPPRLGRHGSFENDAMFMNDDIFRTPTLTRNGNLNSYEHDHPSLMGGYRRHSSEIKFPDEYYFGSDGLVADHIPEIVIKKPDQAEVPYELGALDRSKLGQDLLFFDKNKRKGIKRYENPITKKLLPGKQAPPPELMTMRWKSNYRKFRPELGEGSDTVLAIRSKDQAFKKRQTMSEGPEMYKVNLNNDVRLRV